MAEVGLEVRLRGADRIDGAFHMFRFAPQQDPMLTKPFSSMRRLAPALLLFVLTGCGGDASPTAPTAPAVPTFQLTGRIVDASAGIALSGVTLSAMDGANAGKTTTTGADGRYTLANLLSGSFTLRAQRDSYEDHIQAITITSHATIDMRMIPGRSVGSGWSGGQLFFTFDGQRVGVRVTTAQVTQSGRTVSGQFTGADGSSGTFTGQLAGTQFTGSMQVELVSGTPTRRCRGTAAHVTGTATGGDVSLAATTVALENCSGSVTDLALTLTP